MTNEKNRSMTKEEIARRVARFDQLQPMSTAKDMADVPPAAMDVIFARRLMPVILEKTKNPFGETAAIFGAAGTTMNVSVCPPGQGPCLHAHNNTYETFMVLDGAFEFAVGEEGQETVRLNKWDVFSCPPGVYRGFRNVADKDSVLLTVITGEVAARDDVGMPPKVTEQIRTDYGEDVLRRFRTIMTFNDREPA
jgi:quercetin dioxygenase-like cupin family protein